MKIFLPAIIFLCFSTISFAQSDPLSLAKLIFAQERFSDINNHITGEYEGRPNGTDLPENVTTDFLLLDKNDVTAVVNITISDTSGSTLDTYLHFVKEDVWKASAFRGLAMTGIIAEIKEILENMSEAQIDSVIHHSKTDTSAYTMFTSKDEYEFELGNARLTLASDNEIIAHFKDNAKEFKKLKDDLLANGIMSAENGLRGMKDSDLYKTRLYNLFVSNVTTGISYDYTDVLNFTIGGMIDNTVGYLFVKDKKNVPSMNPQRIIMIREIGNGWYIYKTT